MTENEAINGLETLKYQCKYNVECGTCNICCSAVPLAIQALEEIQQYRAIGTIEEFKALKENQFFNFDSPVVRVDKKSYDKAIDEFAERLSEKSYFTRSDDFVVDVKAIEELAEQMKGGAE